MDHAVPGHQGVTRQGDRGQRPAGGAGLHNQFVELPLLRFAAYAARQSSEHRQAQRQAEQMALQLAALKPYLDDMRDEAKRDELLAVIAQKLFGQATPVKTTITRKEKRDDTDTMALLAQAMTLIQTMTKSI